MGWPLKLVTWEEFKERRTAARTDADRIALVGLCWFSTPSNQAHLESGEGKQLSPNYRRDWAGKRLAFWICMPAVEVDILGYQTWCPDCLPTDNKDSDGWKVIGEPPNVSITPSINCVSDYHGWVKDGQLSDDCDGRQYAWLK